MAKKIVEEVNEFQHPYNHEGNVPTVAREDINTILEDEGNGQFKVRMNDGVIATVQIGEKKMDKKKKSTDIESDEEAPEEEVVE